MNIAVYCGSAFGSDAAHAEAARKLGRWIGENGHTLVYGGSNTGLMGETANAAMAAGGRVVGVLPDVKLIHERRHPSIAEYIYTSNMSERKQKMMELSDAFIALPGGLGTLDELSDVLCLNRLGVFRKPIALVNTHGFYEPVRQFLLNAIDCGYLGGEEMDSLRITDDLSEIEAFLSAALQ